MSRIDEARRRATGGDGTSVVPAAPATANVFDAPWQFPSGTVTLEPPEAAPQPAPAAPQPPALHRSLTTTDPPLLSAGHEPGGVVSGFNSQWNERLVVSRDADPMLVEQFRRLAATLHQSQTVNNVKTVMITSASPSDGKTLTAINLALILSESYGRQVLLIDADLRRPSIRDTSHMPNVVGLSDGLRAKTEQKLTALQITKNLTLLPAGRPDPDPMSSLTSERMRRIIDDASSRFEWVVVDAPPVGTVSDASLLAAMIDAVVLVIRAGQTQCGLVKKAIEAVGPERILGVVLNGVEEVDGTEYARYGYSTGAVGGAERS
jgi:capsular exopolysaccharide synthesis family protein